MEKTMAQRPLWQGHLRLSLVTCPVTLFTATSRSNDVSFHLINPKTNNRIRMIATDPDKGPVERADLVKGYEFEKDRYVLLTPDEIKAVRIESNRVLDIESFVDQADIDRMYWDEPYFLTPEGKLAAEPFAVIRDAMSKSKKIALSRVVLHGRERLMALEPRDNGILAYTMRTKGEVRDVDAAFDGIPRAKPDKAMLDIAAKIIEQKSGPFDPDTFKDRYEEALKDLIKSKLKGKKVVAAPEPEDTPVDDLMAALKESLKRTSGGERRAPARATTAKRPATERKATPRRKAG
jgi:DNA end-binding protein Ku